MAARIVVDNRVRILCSSVSPEALAEIQEAFKHRNPKHAMLVARGWRNRYQLGKEREFDVTWCDAVDDEGRWLTVPRGGLQRVRDVLRLHGFAWTMRDARSTGPAALHGQLPRHRVTLRDYQEEAVVAALARENCIIRAPTGAGKTTIGFAAIARAQVPALVVVWDGNLHDQWVRRCGTELGLARGDVAVVKGKRLEYGPVTVAMQQSLDAHPEYLEEHRRSFGMLLCDEVQRFAAPTLFRTVDPWPARYRIGISADERRKDRKEYLVHDLFAEAATSIDPKRLVDGGHILDVDIVCVLTQFRAPWFRRLVDAGEEKLEHYQRLSEEMCADEERTALAVGLVEDEARRGETTLVWAARREQCHAIDSALARRGVLSGLLIGGADYADRFDETLAGIDAGRLRAGVGTMQSIGQAIDMPRASRGVLTVPCGGNRQKFNQARGRLVRPGTRDALLYYLVDPHVHGAAHVRKLAAWYGRRVVVRGYNGVDVPAKKWRWDP